MINLPTWYDTGTVSVAGGSTTVTLAGGFWGDDGIMVGDLFCDPAQPLVPPQRIKAVTSEATLTLWAPWPGTAMTADPYEIRYVGIIERSTAQSRRVLEQLGDVKTWADVFVQADADRLALDTPSNPLRSGVRVLVANDGTIWAKATGIYNEWIGPASFSGPQGDPGPYTTITFGPVTTLPAGSEASATHVVVGPGAIRIDLSVPKGLDGTGTGDTVGPAGALADRIAVFNGTTGKMIKDGGKTIAEVLADVSPSGYSDLVMTVSQIALAAADSSNVALFLGPTGNRVADSFDALTYVDVAGATNLDVSLGGVLKPTQAGGNDSSTKVLLPFDGANGANSISDINIGGSAHTWTPAGGTALSTTSPKFGSAKALFDGTDDYWSTPDHADFALGSGDFTLDFWFNVAGAAGGNRGLAGHCDPTASPATTSFTITHLGAGNFIRFSLSNGSALINVDSTTAFSVAGWHHFEAVRTGSILKLFLDGVQEGGNVAFTGTVPDAAQPLVVGRLGSVTSQYFAGSIDEFRLSNGARHTANFTPPAAAYALPTTDNLTVRSASFVAASAPTKMKALVYVKEIDAATAGTDYALECSRNAGANWTAMALAELYTMPNGFRVVDAAETSVSGQPSGTSPRWRFKTLNNKNVELHDVYFYWS